VARNKKHSPEQIIDKLREADALLASGCTVGQVCAALGITKQTFYRWRKGYGGLKADQAERLKELERENTRLRKAVADLTLDKLVLKEVLGKDR
jgi:transposase-like protein